MTRHLRDYQGEAVVAIYDEWDGVTRTAAVMATGLGKTDVIAKVATDEAAGGGRVLILAHRGELLDQIAERCRMHRPDIAVGRVQAGRNESRRPITVAMAPTLANAKRRARTPKPTLVIVDECHHAVSDGYLAILRWAGCLPEEGEVVPADWRGTPMLGVTATLTRGDKRGLGDVFESVAFTRDIAWAITHGPSDDDPLVSLPVGQGASHGWLVRPRGRVVVADHMDLEHAKVSRGDFQDRELGELVSQDTDQIVKAWAEHAADRLTVAFVPSIQSANDLRDEYLGAGVPAEIVIGSTPPAERTATYARLAAGTTRVMVGVGVPTEGFDLPALSCVLMARPTKLAGLYTQMVGRGLRLAPGKADCLVLDVVGTSRRQRLVTLIDLHPSAVYDRDELDAIPCEDCDLPLRQQYPGQETCACEREAPGPRDPDGGRIRLQGPAKYEEVDLLGLADSGFNWLATRRGIPFLSVGTGGGRRRYAVLWREANGLYSAGHCDARDEADREAIVEYAQLEVARRRAELWAQDWAPDRADDPWRVARKRASDKQVAKARGLGVANAERFTSGGISNEIDIVLASRRLDRV